MRILLSTPYVGEIGWELMSWQARVRWVFRQGGYDRLVVMGAPGKEAFYADAPLEYEPIDLAQLPGTAYEDRRFDIERGEIIPACAIRAALAERVETTVERWRQRGSVELIAPAYEGRLFSCASTAQDFIPFAKGSPRSPRAPWVLFVQRQRALAAGNNWPASLWELLRVRLEESGVTTSVYPCEAGAAIEALSSCDLAIGYSTGGLHLASLCGCPHVVWSCGDETRWTPWQMTNRQRYETFWNPLGTPVEYHPASRCPEVEEVAQWVLSALRRIGRRTGSRMHHFGTRARWRMRSLVARRVLISRLLQRCPWSMQEWVRYGLI